MEYLSSIDTMMSIRAYVEDPVHRWVAIFSLPQDSRNLCSASLISAANFVGEAFVWRVFVGSVSSQILDRCDPNASFIPKKKKEKKNVPGNADR